MTDGEYYGDELEVLQGLPDQAVDKVNLDSRFDGNVGYDGVTREPFATRKALGPQAPGDGGPWRWGDGVTRRLEDLASVHAELAEYLDLTLMSLGRGSLSTYLVFTAPILVELHRVLKPGGFFFGPCDPAPSPHLEEMLDLTFALRTLRNGTLLPRSDVDQPATHVFPAPDGKVLLFYNKLSGSPRAAPGAVAGPKTMLHCRPRIIMGPSVWIRTHEEVDVPAWRRG